jgi:hypothetical protein
MSAVLRSRFAARSALLVAWGAARTRSLRRTVPRAERPKPVDRADGRPEHGVPNLRR